MDKYGNATMRLVKKKINAHAHNSVFAAMAGGVVNSTAAHQINFSAGTGLVRDNKYFMYPFFYIAFRGRNIKLAMEFKKEIYRISKKEYDNFYNTLNAITTNRLTDINGPSMNFIFKIMDQSAKTLIDIGNGNGYLLRQIKTKHPELELYSQLL